MVLLNEENDDYDTQMSSLREGLGKTATLFLMFLKRLIN
ncbi:hypothetical protein THIOSC13_900003 [uncultured Thiomicrorhabdus sp.]